MNATVVIVLVVAVILSVISFVLRFTEISFWKNRKKEIERDIKRQK